ncbi:unnamed protein product, partial [Polarella glacialis]
VDDDIAQIISKEFDPQVKVLLLADACCSAGVLDCDTKNIWSGRHFVCAMSGCQNTQSSTDTDNGGAMTNALLTCLSHKKIQKMRKAKKVSIQYIFNRMVEHMPDSEEEDGDDDEEDSYSEDEDEESESEDDDDDGLDPMTGEKREEGQNINLSWPSACMDPSKVHFPF